MIVNKNSCSKNITADNMAHSHRYSPPYDCLIKLLIARVQPRVSSGFVHACIRSAMIIFSALVTRSIMKHNVNGGNKK